MKLQGVVRKKLNNEEFHNWYSSQNIITVMKSWRVKGKGHVAMRFAVGF
jgi:hypothetical protein